MFVIQIQKTLFCFGIKEWGDYAPLVRASMDSLNTQLIGQIEPLFAIPEKQFVS